MTSPEVTSYINKHHQHQDSICIKHQNLGFGSGIMGTVVFNGHDFSVRIKSHSCMSEFVFGLSLKVTAYNQFLCRPNEPDCCAFLLKHIQSFTFIELKIFLISDNVSQMLCIELNSYLMTDLRTGEIIISCPSPQCCMHQFPSTPSVLPVEVLHVNICGLSVIH